MTRTLLTLLLAAALPALAAAPDPAGLAFFESRVRPILVEHCYKCHSASSTKLRGELRLDSREALLKGGTAGPGIVPGDPAAGPLLKAISYADPDLQMPPKRQLPQAAIDDLKRWIAMGAPWPEEPDPTTRSIQKPNPTTHWAFKPITAPAIPQIANRIDYFVRAVLAERDLAPAPPADRRTLIRRATFDLLGLPPTPAEVDAFVNDSSPEAFATVVDRLLASPHYGERQGRHWLDLARYADTNGADENYAYHNAWRYRDYVVRAFNADKPYDRFVTEQLAGDLLPSAGASDEQIADRLTATGFLVIGPKMLAEQDKARLVMDVVDEQIDATAQTFLGLTVGCARCHDHKFDPIPTADYYALAGVFKSTKTMANLGFVSEWNERDLLGPAARAEREKLTAAGVQVVAAALDNIPPLTAPRPLPPLGKRVSAAAFKAQLPTAMAVAEDKPVDVPVHLRGSHLTLAKTPTPRGFVKVLDAVVTPPPIPKAASGRLELARWITDPKNPLTARVMANRIWQTHFGAGLVSTPSNFGLRGQPPTHPELLDYLAAEFVRHGWSIKHLHRQIMLSATYQQSSAAQSAVQADPDNRLLSHQNRRRLEAEAIRDALFAVGGNLDLTVGGTLRPLMKEKYSSLNERDPVFDSPRRAIYIPIVRSRMYDLFNTFDYVDAGVHTPRRPVTTVPQQALFMLNNPLVARQAALLAQRLQSEVADDPTRVGRAYEILYGRPPTAAERSRALGYVESRTSAADLEGKGLAVWSSLCRALIAANEFVYIK